MCNPCGRREPVIATARDEQVVNHSMRQVLPDDVRSYSSLFSILSDVILEGFAIGVVRSLL
jgi:hypothetical protein